MSVQADRPSPLPRHPPAPVPGVQPVPRPATPRPWRPLPEAAPVALERRDAHLRPLGPQRTSPDRPALASWASSPSWGALGNEVTGDPRNSSTWRCECATSLFTKMIASSPTPGFCRNRAAAIHRARRLMSACCKCRASSGAPDSRLRAMLDARAPYETREPLLLDSCWRSTIQVLLSNDLRISCGLSCRALANLRFLNGPQGGCRPHGVRRPCGPSAACAG